MDVATQEQQKISPAQRKQYFNQLTRQHIQPIAGKAWTENSTVSFEIPKARLLSRIKLLIEGTVNAVHASTTALTPAANAPFNLVSKIDLNLNIGFIPYSVSGVDAYFLNLLRANADIISPLIDTNTVVAASRAKNKLGKTAASSTGADNKLQMVIDLPLTLNDSDPSGLIMLQAPDIFVTLDVTMGSLSSLFTDSSVTYTLSGAKITPILETFSIPSYDYAIPDLSVIKLVHNRQETISAAGVKTVSLPTGNMYRKLLVFVSDASGGEADADLTTNFELIFNTADKPYSIPHRVLAEMNQQEYGKILPQGLYVFDFAGNSGVPNFGSARDYLNTKDLAEMELSFTAAAAGSVRCIYETLTVLNKKQ